MRQVLKRFAEAEKKNILRERAIEMRARVKAAQQKATGQVRPSAKQRKAA
jgi:hypothetical protein